jgi:hypothetical protein
MQKFSVLFRTSALVFGLIIASQSAWAQANVRDSTVSGILVTPSLSIQFPGGDMAESYGYNLDLGLDVWYKTRSNWLVGAGGSFLFGDEVKRSAGLFSLLESSNGQVFDLTGNYAGIKVFERGFTSSVQIGRLWNKGGHNPNSGLLVVLGAGWIQHRTRIESGSNVPQLSGELLKGYDQLRMGPMLRQFVGYMHSGNARTINFMIGLDLVQGFTENVRVWDYSTNSELAPNAFDLLVGIKFAWFLPIYSERSGGSYYYR